MCQIAILSASRDLFAENFIVNKTLIFDDYNVTNEAVRSWFGSSSLLRLMLIEYVHKIGDLPNVRNKENKRN